MALRETITAQGNWLFKYRSYVPVPIFLGTLYLSAWMEPPGQVGGWWRHWDLLCLAISMLGLIVRGLTAGYVPDGTSGRNTRSQVADELNTAGLYSLVRNPLYLGNFLLSLGAVMYVREWWFAGLYVAIFYFYYERIIFAEEAFIREKFKAPYLDWAARTPLLIPKLTGWKSPPLSFSPRVLIRRETATLSAMFLTFFLLEVLQGYGITGKFNWHPGWVWTISIVFVCYLVQAILLKTTRVFQLKRSGREPGNGEPSA